MPRLVAILALPLAFAAVPAAAQYGGSYGPPAGAPPVNYGPAPVNAPFTGLRVEGLVGWDRFQNHGHSNGVAYGVAAGYDVQYRRAIVGVEGEFSDSNQKQCEGAQTAIDPEICAKLGRDFYAGGRVGVAVMPNAMVYGKAGYTNERVRVTYDDGTFRDRAHADLDGVRVGAGVEYQLFSNAYAKAEYRYSNYEQGFSRNQVVGGFGVRFR
ncbi:outer membrane protein [Sphingomonas sp.]|uniref:outer membrane protein n=1 Tax=Sphingomonas sp. TaxID=28214 RepID=UPI003AFF7B5E